MYIQATKKLLSANKKNSTEIIIALIDTGIDIEHADLKNILWENINECINMQDSDKNGYIDDINGWNFCDNTCNINQYISINNENSHGTACAGIISANDNGNGIIGVTSVFDNIKIMSLKVLNGYDDNTGSIDSVIQAIEYAEQHGAKICNLSFNTTSYSEELKYSIMKSKMLFVVSAGNGISYGKNIDKNISYPCSFGLDNVITVSGISSSGKLVQNSNYGSNSVDILAPGEDILSTVAGNNYAFLSGTSFAAPYVTGVAAILYSFYPEKTSSQIKYMLLDACPSKNDLKNVVKQGKVLNLDYVQKRYLY